MIDIEDYKNKIFKINLSDIESRLDPHFYQPKYQELTRLIENNSAVKLGELIRVSNETWNQKDYFVKHFPYIEISEIDTYTGKINTVRQVLKSEAPSRAKKIVREGDIIVSTTRPNRGAISYITKDYDFNIASTGFAVLRNLKDSHDIKKQYLFTILRQEFCLKQMEQRSSGGNYPAIIEDELKKVLIPIPNLEIQAKVIRIRENSQQSKFKKEYQAQQLLESIDDFLLKELGIKLPKKDNSLQARIFSTTFQKLTGNRFDPKLYDTHSQNLFKAISNSKFDKKPLKELIIQSDTGDWGLDESKKVDEEEYTKCLVIRATEFDNLYNLKLENDRVRYRLIKNDKLYKLDIQPNDLLIEKSGGSPDQPVGRISILKEDLFESNDLCFSNFIHKIRVDETKVLPEYLFCFLKTIHNIKITEIMQSQTNGIRNLIMREYFNQQIVLPPIDKQKEIATEANRRRFEAQRLEKEAKETLEQARQEIEKIILE